MTEYHKGIPIRTVLPVSEMPEPEKLTMICDLVASGESLARSCGAMKIHPWDFYRRCNEDPELDAIYTHARQSCADVHASRIIDKAMELLEGPSTLSHAQVTAIRAGIDTLKWTASRLFQDRWGEKTTTTHDVGGGFLDALDKIEQLTQERRAIKAKVIDVPKDRPERQSAKDIESVS